MLKYRILTAVALIPIFLLLLFFLPAKGFAIFTGLLMLIGAWEWTLLLGVNKFPQILIFPAITLAVMIASVFVSVLDVLMITLVWWICATFLVIFYPRSAKIWGKSIVVRAFMGLMVLVPCWLALNLMRNAEDGIYIILFLFILIWGADTGAYFSGKLWGKHKLLPQVSPGKTWEGLVGALVITILIAFVALFGFNIPSSQWLWAILLSIVTILFSVVGDLFESMLKRNVGVKDSGTILPGHGGLLDRIDSLTAAAPVFTLGAMLMWMEYQG